MNQSRAIPVKVLIKSLHFTASEPPTNIICVWNAVRCASGSSIPVKLTLGLVNVLEITVSKIARENGVVNSLGGRQMFPPVDQDRLCAWLVLAS